MLDLVTLATKGTKSPAGQSSVIAAFSRFVLVAVHGELPRQAAGMCAALLARTVAATVVTERNGKPPCVQAASPPGRRIAPVRWAFAAGARACSPQTLGLFGLTPPLTSGQPCENSVNGITAGQSHRRIA